ARRSRMESRRSPRFVAALLFAALAHPTFVRAQVAGSAGLGASVPAAVGPFEVRAGAFVDRLGSAVAPRTTLNVGASIALPIGSGGVWLGARTLQAREIDTLPARPLLEGGVWRTLGAMTFRLSAASHVAQVGGRAPRVLIIPRDSTIVTDSGVPIHVTWN